MLCSLIGSCGTTMSTPLERASLSNHMKESVKTYSGHYAGAMACSWFFERRLWCRHLCPIGGMNGMFAKLSMTELRAHTGICSGDSRWVIVVFCPYT